MSKDDLSKAMDEMLAGGTPDTPSPEPTQAPEPVQPIETVEPEVTVSESTPEPEATESAKVELESMLNEATSQPEEPTTQPIAQPITPAFSEPTPAVQPIAPEPTLAQTEPEKPKSKKLLFTLIGAALGVLLLAGAAVWFFAVRQNPVRVVNNAIFSAINSRQTAITGNINIDITDTSNPIRSVRIDIESESEILPSRSTASMSVVTRDNSEYRLTLSEVSLRNGDLYFKIDDLQATYERLIDMALEDFPVIENVHTLLTRLVGEIDGQWWRVSMSDFTDMLGEDGPTGVFSCAIDTVGQLIDSGTIPREIAEVYRKNPFIVGERNQDGLYNVTIDSGKLNAAVQGMENTQLMGDLVDCFGEDLETGDLWDMGHDPNISLDLMPEILLDISYFSHRLNSIQINLPDNNQNGFTLSARFDITHPRNIDISAPENARPITDLGELFGEIVQELLGDMFTLFDWDDDWDTSWDWDSDWDMGDWDTDWNWDDEFDWILDDGFDWSFDWGDAPSLFQRLLANKDPALKAGSLF